LPESLQESPPEEPRPVAEPSAPEEAPPPVEQAPETPPPPETFPSPLDDDVLESREVRDYLRAAAPILEELSLLMTRVPSLVIEDFDPSNANAPVVGTDVLAKMDSTRRDLQILDSKTFSIIPPPKYAQFHSRIRESITETYQACEAIINFFNERTDEDLRRVQEHLLRARDLILDTRRREQIDRG